MLCNYVWRRLMFGTWVRCELPKGHDNRHKHGLAWVRVGREESAIGYWGGE